MSSRETLTRSTPLSGVTSTKSGWTSTVSPPTSAKVSTPTTWPPQPARRAARSATRNERGALRTTGILARSVLLGVPEAGFGQGAERLREAAQALVEAGAPDERDLVPRGEAVEGDHRPLADEAACGEVLAGLGGGDRLAGEQDAVREAEDLLGEPEGLLGADPVAEFEDHPGHVRGQVDRLRVQQVPGGGCRVHLRRLRVRQGSSSAAGGEAAQPIASPRLPPTPRRSISSSESVPSIQSIPSRASAPSASASRCRRRCSASAGR